MKLITAVVLPYALDDVRRALERHAVLGMTVTEISDAAPGQVEVHKGVSRRLELVPRLRIETVVHDDLVDRVVDQILANLSGTEGRVTVVPVDAVLRVRTGERGADAV
jgi:nitrogen regulatory protein P-II 1